MKFRSDKMDFSPTKTFINYFDNVVLTQEHTHTHTHTHTQIEKKRDSLLFIAYKFTANNCLLAYYKILFC